MDHRAGPAPYRAGTALHRPLHARTARGGKGNHQAWCQPVRDLPGLLGLPPRAGGQQGRNVPVTGFARPLGHDVRGGPGRGLPTPLAELWVDETLCGDHGRVVRLQLPGAALCRPAARAERRDSGREHARRHAVVRRVRAQAPGSQVEWHERRTAHHRRG
ncbi:hypothetical protein D3C80_1428060 [compost metagenome]